MARTIAESMELLKTALDGDKEALINKKVTVPEITKHSNVPSLIAQIKSGESAKITVTCSEDYEGTELTFTNGNSVIKEKVSNGKCVVTPDKAGTWTVTNTVDDQSLTVEVKFNEYALELKGRPKYVYACDDLGKKWQDTFKLSSISSSSITGGPYTLVFTDTQAPGSVTTYDLSKNKDRSVVGWKSDKTVYVSSQVKGVKIHIPCNYSYSSSRYGSITTSVFSHVYQNYDITDGNEDYWYDSSCVFNNIQLNNCVTVAENTDYSYFFKNYMGSSLAFNEIDGLGSGLAVDISYMLSCVKNITSVDVSNLNINNVTKAEYVFEYCSNLQTIYCNQDWTTNSNIVEEYIFSGDSKLPGYSSSKKTGAYAKPISQGGYFTPKN